MKDSDPRAVIEASELVSVSGMKQCLTEDVSIDVAEAPLLLVRIAAYELHEILDSSRGRRGGDSKAAVACHARIVVHSCCRESVNVVSNLNLYEVPT